MVGITWAPAPLKTQWGLGMMEALVELDKDHTLRLYAEVEAIPLVHRALAIVVRDAQRKLNQDLLKQSGDVVVNGAQVLCENFDREPCPHQPHIRCGDCPGGRE